VAATENGRSCVHCGAPVIADEKPQRGYVSGLLGEMTYQGVEHVDDRTEADLGCRRGYAEVEAHSGAGEP
jgi:hypothetical protein